MQKRTLAALTVLALAGPAFAQDKLRLTHFGRLLNAEGTPVTTVTTLTFTLYTGQIGQDNVFTDSFPVEFDPQGQYAVVLGDEVAGHKPLPADVFSDEPLFLGITVGEVALSPRLPLTLVPAAQFARKARLATTAENVECEGCVTAEALAGGIPASKLETLTLDKLPNIPPTKLDTLTVDKLPTIPSDKLEGVALDKLPTIPSEKLAGVALDKLPEIPGSKLAASSVAGDRLKDASVPASKLTAEPCLDGQTLKFNAGTKSFDCQADVGLNYAAGSGIAITGSTIAVRTDGVSNGMLQAAAVTLDKLGGACSDGQIIKRVGGAWQCGTDLSATSAGGGLSVSAQAPLAGDGTSGLPLGLADKGITAAKIADGTLTPDKFGGLVAPFVVRGTGNNNVAPASVKIAGVEKLVTARATGRGLTLTIVNKADGAWVSSDTYDTYGNTVDAAKNLSDKINLITRTQVGIITSYDAFEAALTDQLRATARRVGLHKLAAVPSGNAAADANRRAYAAIFEVANTQRPTARAVEILRSLDGANPFAEIRGFFIDGSFDATGDLPSVLVDAEGTRSLAVALNSSTLGIPGAQVLEFGALTTGKEGNAGKIGYGTFTVDSLDIVGAGLATGGAPRRIKLWDAVTVGQDLAVGRNLGVNGTTTLTGVTNTGALTNNGPATISGAATVTGTLTPAFIAPARADWPGGGYGFGNAAIANDGGTYKALMVIGNDSGGGGIRRVGLWDDVAVNRNLAVGGGLTVTGASVLAATTVNGTLATNGSVLVSGGNFLEFGAGVAGKEVNAGRIGYGTFSSGAQLDIVGAGTNGSNRKVQVFAEGGMTVNGRLNTTGGLGGTCVQRQTGCGTDVSVGTMAFLDRLAGQCAEGEYMNGFRFTRCGPNSNGMLMDFRCCK